MKVKMRRVLKDLWIEPDEDAEGKAPRTVLEGARYLLCHLSSNLNGVGK